MAPGDGDRPRTPPSNRTKDPAATPSLEERRARALSLELTAHRGYGFCQSCGAVVVERAQISSENALVRWIEADEWDKIGAGERPCVGLCQRCSDREIEKHPRMYHRLETWEPYPGAMAICVGCRWQNTDAGMRCGSPLARYNGGAGLAFQQKEPTIALVRYCRKNANGSRSGRVVMYGESVQACSGRQDVNEGRDEEHSTPQRGNENAKLGSD